MATYYSPDAILTESQKAPLTFELAVPQLTPINNGAAVEIGTKLELPFWLAEMLAVSTLVPGSSEHLASLDMPSALGQRVVNALRADPKSVDIRAQATSFYGLAERILNLFEDEDLLEVLNDTFKQRALEIADKAQNSRSLQQSDEFMRGLDEREVQLFRAAHEGNKAVKEWFDNAGRT